MRQETNGMNSRFTKELSPQNVDWHYVECRVNSFTGSAQVYLGFAPRDDVATFGNLHVGYKGTSGFGVAVYNSEVYLGNSGVARANTKLRLNLLSALFFKNNIYFLNTAPFPTIM